MNWMKPLSAFLMIVSLMVLQGFAEEEGFEEFEPVIERPENHIWDRDNLFRNDPEAFTEISEILSDLEEECGFELYLVTYSSLIGEKPEPFSMRCHEQWLGDENDGLVVVLSFNDSTSGAVGRSRKLYEGQFIDREVMPRVSFANFETILKESVENLQKEKGQIDRVRVFTQSIAERLKERLAITEEESASKESYHFMGWMAAALLGCGVLIGLLSKFMGRVDRRSKKVYSFPDFTVPERLKASNGGGKISVVNFDSLPSSGGQ
jgi:uncharacterized membrane protein YgcG